MIKATKPDSYSFWSITRRPLERTCYYNSFNSNKGITEFSIGYYFSKRLAVEADIEADTGLSFSIAVPFIGTVHTSFVNAFLRRNLINKVDGDRRYGFYACGTHFHMFFNTCDGDSSKGWDWCSYLIHWDELLKGRIKHVSRKELETVEFKLSTIPNPNYPTQSLKLTVTKIERVQHFSRWFPFKFYSYDVYTDQPSWHQGKGENGWDCEPDYTSYASYGISCTSHAEAARRFVADIENSRQRYG